MWDRKNGKIFIYLRRVLALPRDFFDRNMGLSLLAAAIAVLKYGIIGLCGLILLVLILSMLYERFIGGQDND